MAQSQREQTTNLKDKCLLLMNKIHINNFDISDTLKECFEWLHVEKRLTT